ncbi:DcuS/MalK family sensor histidine kinase [Sporosarcina sp. JAI121]|uniref:DcuS/MalK family sensor histidine kinase n=1 Tax=Sporosarcina sp. JAI121 TaxID=2723064 RepID=UPI0015CA7523|nr:DcuS/MalK family sensor histidine kinase [Sporosarcina sp. JAI121]NYF23715.1 CitB family two-component system sensor histidine kinase MalK [Sporosarcina sp. JAI121]
MSVFKRKKISLQTRLTLLVCTVVLVSLSVTGYLIGSTATENARNYQAEKVMDIASTISHSQLVIDSLSGVGSGQAIQSYTKSIQDDTNVEYIVVMNSEHIRQSHPIAERIGQYFVGNDEDRAFLGERYTSVAKGTLGESMRAFVPIRNGEQIIGVVSVGILLDNIQSTVLHSVRASYIGIGAGLLIGIIGAFFLARRVKQTLFGLEPREIANLLREREAMLESVREGVIGINDKEEIIVANQAAIHLFRRAGLLENPVGQQVQSYLPPSLLQDLLLNERLVYDQEQKLNGIDIIVNKVPVISNKHLVGALATFRDKSELTSLIEQLSGAKAYAETLRAQTHEFMNKLHVITAMIHTKSYEELKEYTTYLSDSYQNEGGSVFRLVKDPVIAGYLISKLHEFQKSGIQVELSGETPLPILKEIERMDKIITILGNLCDNAYEAVSLKENKRIHMTITYIDKQFHFSLLDNGSGLIVENDEALFKKGLSTKGEHRGYGLYLTKNALDELGGTLDVISIKGDGAQFHVKIPYEGEES